MLQFADSAALNALKASVTGIISGMPQPATTMPPSVNDMGAQGSAVKYAREDHTHKSSFQAKTLIVAATGKFTWTFDQPFADGVVPICSGTARVPGTATNGYIVNVVEGSETNLKVDYLILKVAQNFTLGASLALLLGAVIQLIGQSEAGVKVNCFARVPSIPTPTP